MLCFLLNLERELLFRLARIPPGEVFLRTVESGMDDETPVKEPPWCPGCGYILEGLVTDRCPECGFGFESLGLAETDDFYKAVGHERASVDVAIILSIIGVFFLMPLLPLAAVIFTVFGGWGTVANRPARSIAFALTVLALLVFYIAAGLVLHSASRSTPLRLARIYPARTRTWTKLLAECVVGVTLLVVLVIMFGAAF